MSLPVPGRARLQLLAIGFAFTTSATVANRFPAIFTFDGSNGSSLVISTTAQTASLSWGYHCLENVNAPFGVAGGIRIIMPVPNRVLLPGWSIKSTTIGLQAGDAYSGVTVTVRDLPPTDERAVAPSLRVVAPEIADLAFTG